MARKYIQKALSVGLSLTLCAGLVVPSFAAATFMDLQHAVNAEGGTGFTTADGEIRYGYGDQVENSGKYEIEAWNDEDGTRNVLLNANVTREGDDNYVGLGTNRYNKDQTLNLDLNGYTVDTNGGETAFQVNSGNVTIQDTSGDKAGTITGGSTGITVGGSDNVVLEDVTITGNDTGILVDGNGASAAINGGSVLGEVTVGMNSSLSITGGTFSDLNVKEYLDDGRGLLSNGNGTYDVVEHNDDNHTFANGACQVEDCDTLAPIIENPATPAAPAGGPETEIDDPVIDIDDPAVPLAAGPVTCGEFIDYLWRHEGEPEADIVVEHEYAPAISWALSIDIISDDSFEPDELVTVAAVREILTSYAQYLDVAMPGLTTLTGGEDEAVLNCDEVLAEFFGEERS